MFCKSAGLQSLPVELLYELELYSLSEELPMVSHHFYSVFKNASPFFRAQYLLGRASNICDPELAGFFSLALRFPICDISVVQAIQNLIKDRKFTHSGKESLVQLPRRLFREFKRPPSGWTRDDHPLPFLRYLYHTPGIPTFDTNFSNGYALTRAVHCSFVPLVEFLLENRASPKCHNRLALKVAVRQKNLDMLKLLVERRPQGKQRKDKKRKLEDRVPLDAEILEIAVTSNATDIVDYLYRDKNVVPNFKTLKRL